MEGNDKRHLKNVIKELKNLIKEWEEKLKLNNNELKKLEKLYPFKEKMDEEEEEAYISKSMPLVEKSIKIKKQLEIWKEKQNKLEIDYFFDKWWQAIDNIVNYKITDKNNPQIIKHNKCVVKLNKLTNTNDYELI